MIDTDKIIIREKKLADAWEDYTWETDPELARLDAAPLTTITFDQYLYEYGNELNYFYAASRRFAVDTPDNKHIGNCSYYNINESRGDAELGIMIGNRDYWDKGYGAEVVTALVNHIFSETNLNRIYLKTLESNTRAQKCFRRCGFVPYGHANRDGFDLLLMELYRDQWQQQSARGEAGKISS